MLFDWDPVKAVENGRKHGVPFSEAATVFSDPLAVTQFDELHSDVEDRYVTIGASDVGHLLIVSHTDRGPVTRIISARSATKSERRDYEDGHYS